MGEGFILMSSAIRERRFSVARESFKYEQLNSCSSTVLFYGARSLMTQTSIWSGYERAVAEAVSRHQYAKASTMLKEALFSAKARDEVDQRLCKSVDDMAALHFQQGDFQNSASLYRALLELKENALGKEHPETARTLEAFRRVLGAAGSLSPRASA